MAVENVCFNSGQAYTVSEWSGLDQAACETAGGVWQLLPLSLETLFQNYFAFDAALFESILGYSVLAFILGLGTSAVITVMQKH